MFGLEENEKIGVLQQKAAVLEDNLCIFLVLFLPLKSTSFLAFPWRKEKSRRLGNQTLRFQSFRDKLPVHSKREEKC